MVYKKNWLTYTGYVLFALFLSGLLLLNSGLYHDISENNLALNISVIVCGIILIGMLYLFSFLASMIKEKINMKSLKSGYYILWWLIFLAAIVIRSCYIYYFIGLNDIFLTAASFAVNIFKIILLYYIAKISLGKIAGIIALFLESFFASEIVLCSTLNYNTVANLTVLFVILLYTIYFKRCNNEKKNTGLTYLIIFSMIFIITAGICISVFLDYSIVVPVVLLIALIISMLFKGFIHALILLFGTAILCVSMYFATMLLGSNYTEQLNSEINNRATKIENIVLNPEETFDQINDYLTDNIEFSDKYIVDLPIGYTLNYMKMFHMVMIIIGLAATILMFFKKRHSLYLIMIYTIGIYLFDANILSCLILIICFIVQTFYNKRDENSFVTNDFITNNLNDIEQKQEPKSNSNTEQNQKDEIKQEAEVKQEVEYKQVTEPLINEDKAISNEEPSENTLLDFAEETIENNNELVIEDTIGDTTNLDKYIIEEAYTDNSGFIEENNVEIENTVAENLTVDESVTEESIVESVVEDYAAEESIAESIVDDYPVEETVAENIVEDYAAEENIAENIIEDYAVEETVAENIVEDYAVEENLTESVVEDYAVEETVAENIVDDYPADESIAESIVEDYATDESITESVVDDYTVEENAVSDISPEEVISTLPVPKAIAYYEDDENVQVKIKNNNEITYKSIDNDKWLKRRERIHNKNIQKGN